MGVQLGYQTQTKIGFLAYWTISFRPKYLPTHKLDSLVNMLTYINFF